MVSNEEILLIVRAQQLGIFKSDSASRELMFHRSAAYDGIHGEDEIAINDILTEICPMRKRIARRVKQAFAIAKRDPARTAEFVSDVLIIIGLLTLVYIAWSSCRGCA